ncbi:hypothetical protein GEMRC1_011191 [Eukaryota sp. GEM-RC1]
MSTLFVLEGGKCLQGLYDSQLLSDQVLMHGDLVLNVHRSIISFHSTYFHNCFTKEFSDKDLTQYDLSHLKVPSSLFESFIKILYCFPVTITHENCYLLLYCSTYFLVDSLKDRCIALLKEHQSEANWSLTTLLQAQERDDSDVYRQLYSSTSEDVKPHLVTFIQSVTDIDKAEPLCLKPSTFDLIIAAGKDKKDVTIWLLKTFVYSLEEDSSQCKEDQVERILFSFDLELLHPKVWSKLLFEPFQKFKIFESVLMKFCFYKFPHVLSLLASETENPLLPTFNTERSGSCLDFSDENRTVVNNSCSELSSCNFAAIDFTRSGFKVAIKSSGQSDYDSIAFWTTSRVIGGGKGYDTNGGGDLVLGEMYQGDVLLVEVNDNTATFSLKGKSATMTLPSDPVFGIMISCPGSQYSIVDS